MQTEERKGLKVALVLFCFPPNKGNIGTAADLDVFPSLHEILCRLRADGYDVEVPSDADALREMLLGGNSESFGAVANVAYRMNVEEYLRLCPYAADIEAEWGAAPGRIVTFGRDLLVQGVRLGNVFVAVQPTFGYEGDPMRLLFSRSASDRLMSSKPAGSTGCTRVPGDSVASARAQPDTSPPPLHGTRTWSRAWPWAAACKAISRPSVPWPAMMSGSS